MIHGITDRNTLETSGYTSAKGLLPGFCCYTPELHGFICVELDGKIIVPVSLHSQKCFRMQDTPFLPQGLKTKMLAVFRYVLSVSSSATLCMSKPPTKNHVAQSTRRDICHHDLQACCWML